MEHIKFHGRLLHSSAFFAEEFCGKLVRRRRLPRPLPPAKSAKSLDLSAGQAAAAVLLGTACIIGRASANSCLQWPSDRPTGHGRPLSKGGDRRHVGTCNPIRRMMI